jgi:nicotinate-nucleotide adenylyltransferase
VAIALFGTSADPPTEGHRVLLQGLLSLYPRVATWASDNPQKRHGAPLALRSRLLAALVAQINDPRLSLEQELSSPWAIETLERAGRRWPSEALVFVVGSDLVAQIPRWREASRLLAGCRLAIAPRGGWPVREQELEALRRLGARIELLDLQVPATASSHVRRQAASAPWSRSAAPASLTAQASPMAEDASGPSPPAAADPAGSQAPADPAAAASLAGSSAPAVLPSPAAVRGPADPPHPDPDPPPADPLLEVPPAVRSVLLEHNLYGLKGPLPPSDPS